MKNQIKLTEEELHFIVEDAVRSYLINEGLDEDFLGGLKGFGNWFGGKAKQAGQAAGKAIGGAYDSAANAVGGAYNSAKDAVGNAANRAGKAIGGAYNSAKDAVGNAANRAGKAIGGAYDSAANAVGGVYNDAKNAYQQGSAQGDLQNVNSSLQSMVQKGILAPGSYKQILRMLNTAMKGQGGQAMAGLSMEGRIRRAVNETLNEMRNRR